MTKKGRSFEKLIAEIESALDNSGAVVKSPDYLPDINSGNPREVDISIKINTGSTDLLIIVECRDRAAKDDVTWIEQLNSKRISVKADKVIAVSSKGWTNGAKKTAKAQNIEIRTYKQINEKRIQKWLKNPTFQISSISYEYLDGTVSVYVDSGVELSGERTNWIDKNGVPNKVFENTHNNTKFSLIDMLFMLCAEKNIELRPESVGYFKKEIDVESHFEQGDILVSTLENQFYLKYIRIVMEVSGHSVNLERNKVMDYSNEEKSIAYRVGYGGKLDVSGSMQDMEIIATLRPSSKTKEVE